MLRHGEAEILINSVTCDERPCFIRRVTKNYIYKSKDMILNVSNYEIGYLFPYFFETFIPFSGLREPIFSKRNSAVCQIMIRLLKSLVRYTLSSCYDGNCFQQCKFSSLFGSSQHRDIICCKSLYIGKQTVHTWT